MRRLALVLLAAGAVAAWPARADALPAGPSRVGIIALPMEEARAIAEMGAHTVALGVFPDSRDPARFLEEIGKGRPSGPPGYPSPFGGRPGALLEELDAAGAGVGVWVSPSMRGHAAVALARAFTPGGAEPTNPDPLDTVMRKRLGIAVLKTAEDALQFGPPPRAGNKVVLVLGIGERTPTLVFFLRGDTALYQLGPRPRQGSFLRGASTRRWGIVAPSDLATWTVAYLGVRRSSTGDFGLEARYVDGDALARLDALEARLVRDEDYGLGLTAATVGAGLGGLVVAALLAWARWRGAAALFLRGAATAPAGYLGGLYIQDARWQVRSLAVAGAFLVGAAFAVPWTRKVVGWTLLLTTAGLTALTILAATWYDPGEPALSLWGNPLVSWRFFGLRNHLAAFLAGGFLAGATLVGFRAWMIAVGALGVGVVVGAPGLGANFVGVVTLALGTAVVLLARAAGRVRPLHVPLAAAVAAGAGVAALLADREAVTHGGRAVEAIRTGGLEVVWRIFSHRARLNYREIADIGPVAFVALALLALGLAAVYAWSVASERGLGLRAAVAGTALAALAAIVIEDSGFLTGGILGLYPGLAFVASRVDPEPTRESPPLGAPAPPAGDG